MSAGLFSGLLSCAAASDSTHAKAAASPAREDETSRANADRANRATKAISPNPSHVTLTYLGVAGWKLSSATGTLLVDPYFTRLGPRSDDAVIAPDPDAIKKYAPAHADVILVSHSHYDHALDVPAVARMTGAAVVGTESTANLARADGVLAERTLIAHGGDVLTISPFSVRIVPAIHSLTGQKNEPIARDVARPMAMSAYGEGGTLQYDVRVDDREIYFVGTANFLAPEVVGMHPDVAVIAVGLREKIPDYTCTLMRALGKPPVVVANHFDDFKKPLAESRSLSADTRADLDAFAREVHACAKDTRVVVPVPLEEMTVVAR